MANFSFDYGNAHWTVLDSNKNVDWTDPSLYDLTINTARFPEDRAVDLLVASVGTLGYRRRMRRGGTAAGPEETAGAPEAPSPQVAAPAGAASG